MQNCKLTRIWAWWYHSGTYKGYMTYHTGRVYFWQFLYLHIPCPLSKITSILRNRIFLLIQSSNVHNKCYNKFNSLRRLPLRNLQSKLLWRPPTSITAIHNLKCYGLRKYLLLCVSVLSTKSSKGYCTLSSPLVRHHMNVQYRF